MLGFVSALTSSAVAAPITYTYTGVGSGTIGALSFTNQPFVIRATGDTSSRIGSSSTFFSIINISADISIGALGDFTFLTPTEFFNNPSSQLGFANASGLTLYGLLPNAQLQAWDMLSSIGPISGTAGLGQWTISPINTSGGVLVFNPGSSAATFQAAVGTTIISVSGPAANNAPGIFPTDAIGVSFTVGQSYSNVTISADLIGNFTGTVYLTNQIGPGTTAAANEIAVATFTSSNPGNTLVGTLQPVMTGVTLQPGTYYLVFTGAQVSGFAQGIQNTLSPTITADVGASQDGFLYYTDSPSGYVPTDSFLKGGPGSGVLEYSVTTGRQGPGPTGCPVSAPTGSTLDFTDRAAFTAATSNLTRVGFGGILPPGEQFGGYSQLDIPGASFATPVAGTFVNITTANYYSPNVYPADFIVDSVNQQTGQPNSNNTLCATLTQPTFAVGLDLGGLGFSGTGSGTITLSNGHTFSIPNLPTVGNTQFVGFISTQPVTSLTFATTNDSWVVEDLLTATPIVNNCSFSLAPTAASFPAQGGASSFQVLTGSSCSWNPIFNNPWMVPPIQPIGGGSVNNTGPGTVRFWVSANPSANARSGTISVGNQTFVINQAGLSCNAALNPSAVVIDASNQSIRIVVKDGPSCSWSSVSNVGWLTIASGGAGTGNASVYIQASANTGGARTGTVTIAGQTLTVQQAAPVQNACGALDVTPIVAPIGRSQPIPEPFFPSTYTQDITVINRSSSVLHAPLWLVLVGVPNHKPSPFDLSFNHPADGQTTCFDPAGSGMFLINGSLSPGQSVTITPIFFVDIGASLSYTPKLLSGTPTK